MLGLRRRDRAQQVRRIRKSHQVRIPLAAVRRPGSPLFFRFQPEQCDEGEIVDGMYRFECFLKSDYCTLCSVVGPVC